ncbi:histidinol-phosphate transaminase [bacterium]|nr:histidinol-phosphate transaminase [bacterium]
MRGKLTLIRPSVRELRPYHLVEHSCWIKLNQNESPYDLPLSFKKELMREFVQRPWNRYPSFTTSTLRRKLADYLNVDEDSLLAGNGSNDLLQLIMAVALRPGAIILIIEPTFTIYRQLAQIAQANLITLNFDGDFAFPVDEILSSIPRMSVDLCILCSPNSPTGQVIAKDDLGAILAQSDGLVLVDEAYHEFAKTDILDLMRTFDNLVVLRTFSKAMGLAGLRLGYSIGPKNIMRELSKAKLPYNLNLFSEFVATRVLQEKELIESRVTAILKDKKSLEQDLSSLADLKIYPSQTNFLMAESFLSGSELFERLAQYGILVRDISEQHPLLTNKVRITVGKPEENRQLAQALRTILESKEVKTEVDHG